MMGVLVGATLAAAAVGVAQDPAGQVARSSAGGGERSLIALMADGGSAHHAVVVIDSAQRVMSIYHVEKSSGRIALKSVRNIAWDLRLDEWDTESPLPKEIRSIMEQR